MRLPDCRINLIHRQQGVVLFISLIVLVAMTLAAIALVRSVDTTNLIAGNLAFKQGTTLSADAATETARNWLLTQTNPTMWIDITTGCGQTNPAPNQPCYYSSTPTLAPGTETPWPNYDWKNASIWLTADAVGNQVKYVIHRLCSATGSTNPPNNCINTQGTIGAGSPANSSKGAGRSNIAGSIQYYYRVTAQVIGPRNTVSYVQTIILI